MHCRREDTHRHLRMLMLMHVVDEAGARSTDTRSPQPIASSCSSRLNEGVCVKLRRTCVSVVILFATINRQAHGRSLDLKPSRPLPLLLPRPVPSRGLGRRSHRLTVFPWYHFFIPLVVALVNCVISLSSLMR